MLTCSLNKYLRAYTMSQALCPTQGMRWWLKQMCHLHIVSSTQWYPSFLPLPRELLFILEMLAQMFLLLWTPCILYPSSTLYTLPWAYGLVLWIHKWIQYINYVCMWECMFEGAVKLSSDVQRSLSCPLRPIRIYNNYSVMRIYYMMILLFVYRSVSPTRT